MRYLVRAHWGHLTLWLSFHAGPIDAVTLGGWVTEEYKYLAYRFHCEADAREIAQKFEAEVGLEKVYDPNI